MGHLMQMFAPKLKEAQILIKILCKKNRRLIFSVPRPNYSWQSEPERPGLLKWPQLTNRRSVRKEN